jgi:hypothetical protein
MSALQAELPRKMNFLDLQKDDLSALLKSWGHPTYRSDQVNKHLDLAPPFDVNVAAKYERIAIKSVANRPSCDRLSPTFLPPVTAFHPHIPILLFFLADLGLGDEERRG